VQDLESFANYGFPESHAWSFGLIAFATAYLKCHYPTEFFMGLLNAWPMGFYPPGTLMHDARRHGVTVRGPCLRYGDWECTVETCDPSVLERSSSDFSRRSITSESSITSERMTIDPVTPTIAENGPATAGTPALRIGWRHVHGIGTHALERLRQVHATRHFTSIEDVVRRAKLQRSEASWLARAGAFGAWEPDRRRAAWVALRAIGDTLALAPARMSPYYPRALSRDELIFLDYSAFGGSTIGHPMEHLREQLQEKRVLGSEEIKRLRGGERVSVAGLVTVRQRPESANGTIFLLLEDEHGFINVIVPASLVEANTEVVRHARFILVEGKFERDGDVRNVVGAVYRELKVRNLAHASHDFH
jgi:error-prone DNA polymerase